jgi:MFS transporter, putative metabolite:H+ symporter
MNQRQDGLDILARLERLPFSNWHRKLMVIGFIGILFDATDFATFGGALPSIAKEFGLNPQQAGFLATIGLAGAFVGALFWGSISDYIGRRTAFQATVGIFALFTGLMGVAWNVTFLSFSRFVANFGLGGEVPVTTTIVAEFMPRSERGRATAIMGAGFPAGQITAAFIGLLIIPNFGWRVLFFVGIVPMALLWFIRRSVPESIRYLLAKGRVADAAQVVEQIEQKIEKEIGRPLPKTEAVQQIEVVEETRVTVFELLSPQLRKRTILLWIVSIGQLWAGNGIIFMLPTILTLRGISLSHALSFILVQGTMGFLGFVVSGLVIDKFGRRPVFFVYYFFGAAFHFWFAMASGPSMYVSIALVGFTNPGVFGAMNLYATELYPTRLRATGAGWYFGVGRIGSFVVPAVVGSMMVAGLGQYVLYTFATSFLISGIACMAIGIETSNRFLDNIKSGNAAVIPGS